MSKNTKSEDLFQDISNEEQATQNQQTNDNDDLNQEIETPKKEGFQPKFWHFLIVAILSAGVWIFWPMLFGSSKPQQQVQPANSSTVLSPNQAMLEASQANQNNQQPPQSNQQPPQTGSTDQLMERVSATANGGIYTSDQVAAINANEETFNKAIADAKSTGNIAGERDAYQAALNMSNQKQQILMIKISNLEKQVIDLKTKETQLKVAVKDNSRLKEKTAKEILVREKLLPVKTYKGAILSNYDINTIYADNAWIEYEGETFSVKVGDRVGKDKSIQIQKIDANSRTILTSAGLIK